MRAVKDRVLAIVSFAAIVTGGALWLLDEPGWADIVWGLGAAVVLVPLTVETVRSLLEGDVGVDAIALVAIAGALILGEQLAGAIVALMMSGGGALEAWAAGRARRELRLLVERAPRIAHRHGATASRRCRRAARPGDVVVVRAGEIVPADGIVSGTDAVVDESALTGEPLPVTIADGAEVRSGLANAGNAFDVAGARPAAESAYASIVRLVARRRERQGAIHTARRQVRGSLSPLHARRGRDRVGGLRRPHARTRGDGRRDPLPAHTRRADRVRRRPLARGPCWGDRERRRRARAPRRDVDRVARQDRHA